MLPIAGQKAEPIGLKKFWGHSWVAGGCFRLENIWNFYLNFLFCKKKIETFFSGQRWVLQLVIFYNVINLSLLEIIGKSGGKEDTTDNAPETVDKSVFDELGELIDWLINVYFSVPVFWLAP